MFKNIEILFKAILGVFMSMINSALTLIIPVLIIGYTYQMIIVPIFDFPFINYVETFLILYSTQMILFIFKSK